MSEQKQQLSIADVMQKSEQRFRELAPQNMKWEGELGFAMQILKNNDYLMGVAKTAPESLQYAITNVAAIGLSLNPAEKQAYLIPRTIKAGGQFQSRIFLEPSYMGLCKLATDSGSIDWVHAGIVHAVDDFTDNGPGEKPTHTYKAFKDRGPIVGVYCTAKTAKGDFLTTTMAIEEINSIMERSEAVKNFRAGKSKSGGPWLSDFKEMAKKTVVRNAFKLWPKTDMHRLAEAIELSNLNEGFEPFVTAPVMGQFTAEQKNYFDQLISSNDGLGMYVFQQTLADQGAFTNLYHSFEKGTKGKYQAVVDQLLAQGQATIVDYRNELTIAAQSGDDLRANELLSELSDDQYNIVESRLDTATSAFVVKLRA